MSFKQFLTEQENQNKQEQEDKAMGAIIELFSSKENPNDEDVHKLAEQLGIDAHEFEGKIYSILSSFFNAGRYKDNPVEPDAEELKKGIKIEMEHTTLPAIARRIALDHLAEGKNYYTELEKMEKNLEK